MPLSHLCTLHFDAPSSKELTFQLLEQVQQIIAPTPHFLFCALTGALHDLPQLSSLNFVSKKKVDLTILLPLFSFYQIPHILLPVGLLFISQLTAMEELILTPPQHNIVIPANFLPSIQTLSFSHNCDSLVISIVPFSTPRLTNLQIVRLSPGCPNDVLFTPEFLTLMQSRFYSQGGAQLHMIKDSTGDILEVLAFRTKAKFCTKPPELELPISFEVANFKFLLTHLEPAFLIKLNHYLNTPTKPARNIFLALKTSQIILVPAFPLSILIPKRRPYR